MMEIAIKSVKAHEFSIATNAPAAVTWPVPLAGQTFDALLRMFRDPRLLEPSERAGLIVQLRAAIELQPNVPEVRVLLGMALCVDLQAQEAMEQLREAARQAPDCFIARLKFGELLMRLRICGQAEEETRAAAQLATTAIQSELARKQATVIRTMLREGIERGGYGGLLARLTPRSRKSRRSSESAPALAGSR